MKKKKKLHGTTRLDFQLLSAQCSKVTSEQSISTHCVKSICISSFSGPYFPVFSAKIRTRKTPNTYIFYAVTIYTSSIHFRSKLPVYNLGKHKKISVFHFYMVQNKYFGINSFKSNLLCKSMDWFLNHRDLCHEGVKCFKIKSQC